MSNWYLQSGKESDVVVDTKISLLRNINGYNFENKCTDTDKENILKNIENIYENIGYNLKLIKLSEIDVVTKMSLVEKNLIPQIFTIPENKYSAILINNEENICIMINGEDHIDIQVFSEGLAIEELKKLAIEIDKKIELLLPYSYSTKYGYLTACPMNVGTGMNITTTMHLIGLAKTKNLFKIIQIVNNFGMNMKAMDGNENEDNSDIYQITNTKTLGNTEDEIAKGIQEIINKVIDQERIARTYLGKTGIELENKLYRAFGLLIYSRKIEFNESIKLLSLVKLGTDMGIISELNDLKVKKMYLYSKTYNMEKYFGQKFDANEQTVKRSEILNKIIKEEV